MSELSPNPRYIFSRDCIPACFTPALWTPLMASWQIDARRYWVSSRAVGRIDRLGKDFVPYASWRDRHRVTTRRFGLPCISVHAEFQGPCRPLFRIVTWRALADSERLSWVHRMWSLRSWLGLLWEGCCPISSHDGRCPVSASGLRPVQATQQRRTCKCPRSDLRTLSPGWRGPIHSILERSHASHNLEILRGTPSSPRYWGGFHSYTNSWLHPRTLSRSSFRLILRQLWSTHR